MNVTVNRCECIMVDVKHNNTDCIRYAIVYRPPDVNLAESIELYSTLLENLKDCNLYILFGDFNLPDICWKSLAASSKVSREFFTLCFQIGAEQCVDFPTRLDNVLDLVLCSTRMLLNSVQCEPPFSTSDHASILCNIMVQKNLNDDCELIPNFRKADYTLINAFLATIDWNSVFENCRCTNDYWSAFKDVINTAIYNFVPFVPSGKRKYTPWFNNTLKHLRSVKKRKWRKYTTSRNIVTYAAYKASASNFRTEFLRSKCEYEKNLFQYNNSNSKFFGYVKSQKSVNYTIPCIERTDGSIAVTDHDKSQEFLKYFSSVFVEDNKVIPEFSTTCVDSLDHFTCNAQNVIKVVRKLKNSSSTGPDGFNIFFVKKILAVIVNPLCKVYNVSLNEGSLPADWKCAYITPVFKKGDPQKACQYRPISLTSVICKILERIVREKLLNYMIKNSIIPKEQHGFMPMKSTVTNLIECMNEWSLNFDKGLATDVIYLDYSKCFDTVCHSKLLYKIAKYGISGSALQWLRSFLLDRVQHVKLNNCISPAAEVKSGVPQGTVLGPVLFLLYSADLPSAVSNCKLSMYADDTKLFKTISVKDDCTLLQNDLNSIAKWADSWQMTLNPSKTKLLTIGNCKVQFDYVLHGKDIEKVSHINDIGVTIQSNLKFTTHCTNTLKKAYYVIRTIFTTFKGHNHSFYMKMYTCYVRPILEYASQIWSPVLITNIDRIERVQRYYTRRLCSRNDDYMQRLDLFNIDSLEERRIKSDIVLFFKLTKNVINMNVSDHYTIVKRNRGHSKHLFLYYSRTDKRKYFWINRIVPHWNKLSNDIVTSDNAKLFKSRLRNVTFPGRGSIYQ